MRFAQDGFLASAGQGGSYFASPITADGSDLLLFPQGDVIVVKTGDKHDVVAINKLDGPITATPAIAANRIYIRTENPVRVRGHVEMQRDYLGIIALTLNTRVSPVLQQQRELRPRPHRLARQYIHYRLRLSGVQCHRPILRSMQRQERTVGVHIAVAVGE